MTAEREESAVVFAFALGVSPGAPSAGLAGGMLDQKFLSGFAFLVPHGPVLPVGGYTQAPGVFKYLDRLSLLPTPTFYSIVQSPRASCPSRLNSKLMLRLLSRFSLTLLALLFLLSFPPTPKTPSSSSLPPPAGISSGHIYYTTDSGPIGPTFLPPAAKNPQIKSGPSHVHFRDPSTAGLSSLLTQVSGQNVTTTSTTSLHQPPTRAPTRRSSIPYPYRPQPPALVACTWAGEIFFLDSAHGWVNLVINSKPDSPISLLLYTTDGGITWHQSEANPCGPAHFSSTLLKMAGFSPDEMHQLCVTHNGGKTFIRERLPAHNSPPADSPPTPYPHS